MCSSVHDRSPPYDAIDQASFATPSTTESSLRGLEPWIAWVRDEPSTSQDVLSVRPRRTAVCALRQDHIGHQLQSGLRTDETAWLDAELG